MRENREIIKKNCQDAAIKQPAHRRAVARSPGAGEWEGRRRPVDDAAAAEGGAGAEV